MRIVLPAVVLGVLGLGTACREPGTARATLVCDEFCSCLTPSPDEQAECNAECRDEFLVIGVTDACFECVTESVSCFWTLEVCLEVCLDDGDDEPPPLPIDGPIPLDAPF